ncbi:MAG: ABC transporter ATP-binding protein [Terrimicrobiaceae bacterium]|nr:ABC transporter ATP-binding protein [Terrimicrobiaceae bacterium]
MNFAPKETTGFHGDIICSPNPYLAGDGIRKSYGDTLVLDDVSFGVERGQCLALLGPSGCGKSTLLSILAGLLPADGGKIRLGTEIIEDAATHKGRSAQERGFAMVFQDLSLWPHLTVEQNVAFGLDYLKVRLNPREKQQRTETVLQRAGMLEMRERLPSTLSGGQQQRVAIARAIVVEPSVLLMDEPLASLDTQLRETLRDDIAALIRRLGITTIYVTHDHLEATTVAHQIAVMNKGRIEQIATPDEIHRYPDTTFVATFLGSASAIPYTMELENLRDKADQPVFPPHPERKGGYLLVRREDARIFPRSQERDFPGDGMIRWKATCIKSSFTGAVYDVHARTRKGEVFRTFTPHAVPLDGEVFVQFDPAQVTYVEK